MNRFMILSSVLAATVAFATPNTPAKAGDFGLHFSGPGYHVDVGRPHYRAAYYGGYYGSGREYYGGGYHSGRRVWHDTSHYDYHPGEYVRHRNHYHYVPGHYDYHEDGHWDHYGW